MTTQVGTIYPEAEEWLGIAREATTGTLVLPTVSIPVEKADPDEKLNYLVDNSIRGMMATTFNVFPGTEYAEFDFSGPVYIDTLGFILHNLMGDYSTTGSSAAHSTTLTDPVAVGATTATVGSITDYAESDAVQIGTGATAEVVILSAAPSGSVITFANTPARIAHLAEAAVAIVVAPFSHVFNLLNTSPGQPVTHTITHYQGISGDYGGNQYGYWCASSCELTFDASGMFSHATKGCSYIKSPLASAATDSFSDASAQAAWEATMEVADTAVYDPTNIVITIDRQVKPIFTASGQQAPYVIARNALNVTGKLTELAQNEDPMEEYLENTQPSVQVAISNGGSGSSLLSATFAVNQAAYDTSKLNSNQEIYYDSTWKAVDNSTNAGYSGGDGPMTVTLQNAIPTF
jgi:hypothetical protein